MAIRLSAPTAKDPAGMAMVTLPLTSVAAAEAYLPLLSLTVPAGTGSPVGAGMPGLDAATVLCQDDGPLGWRWRICDGND